MSMAGIGLLDTIAKVESDKKRKRVPTFETTYEDDYGNQWAADFIVDEDGDAYTLEIHSICLGGHDVPVECVSESIRENLLDQADCEYADEQGERQYEARFGGDL